MNQRFDEMLGKLFEKLTVAGLVPDELLGGHGLKLSSQEFFAFHGGQHSPGRVGGI